MFNNPILSAIFIETVAWLFILIPFFYLLSFLPRKFIISGDYIYIKSETFDSRMIPLRSISSVNCFRAYKCFKYLFKNFKLINVYTLLTTLPGTHIIVLNKDDDIYLLNLKHGKAAVSEISEKLQIEKYNKDTKDEGLGILSSHVS
tara:strand:+ start:45 stop:482 length:438 start_codon:yes stop_codon:yes gene_type:complete